MYLLPTSLKNHRLASLKWKKTRPSVSDSVVDKFSHASQTRARGDSLNVSVGDIVSPGQQLMLSGTTPNVAAHLHYEVIRTTFNLSNSQFYNNINIRYAPNQLFNLLRN